MNRIVFALASLSLLGGCSASFGGAPLVSGQSPASGTSFASEPQPANSLPPGAEGLQPSRPATQPNLASVTLSSPR